MFRSLLLPPVAPTSSDHVLASRPALTRALLLVGCAAALGVAAYFGHPQALLTADPELARLRRGMAIIKAAIALAAVAAIFWRLRWSISFAAAAAYICGAWLVVGSSMFIWQLSYLVGAAAAFHVGAFAIVLAAFRDGKARQRLVRPNPSLNADAHGRAFSPPAVAG
jgi:hypothetical protein